MSRVSEFLANQQLTLSLSIQNNAKDRAYTRCLNFGHQRPPKKHTNLLFILFGVLILTFGEGVVNYIAALLGGLI